MILTKDVLIVPDIHFPWYNPLLMEQVLDAARSHEWDMIIQLGDAIDQYSWSRFPRDVSLVTPMVELRKAMDYLQAFWSGMRTRRPNARLVQLLGNHDIRIMKKAETQYPEVGAVLDALGLYEKVYGQPGVELIDNQREIFRYDGVAYHHGDFLRSMVPGKRAAYLGEPVVFGHTHRMWHYEMPDAGGIFELNAGTLSDSSAKPLQYTATDKPWQCEGFAMIRDGRPQLVRGRAW